jgi:hypothetical protein
VKPQLARVVGEAASDEHQKLVKALIDKFVNDGLTIRQASYSGYDQPEKMGRHDPDILARNDAEELTIIGEAKTCDDLTSDRSKEQFQDFSNRQMITGKSKEKAVPFHVIVPKACEEDLAVVLKQLGISNKPNVFRWNLT